MTQHRRLSDKILQAHKQACDENNLEVATTLLRALELDLSQIGGDKEERRNSTKVLEKAYDRQRKLVAGN